MAGDPGDGGGSMKRNKELIAEYGIPYASDFKRSSEGFKVIFPKIPVGLGVAMESNGFIGLLGLGLIAAVRWKTEIEVTKQHVIIEGTTLKRVDFGQFAVSRNFQVNGRSLCILGYSFGRRSYPFGGVWEQSQGTEVAAALNIFLRSVDDGERVSAAKLRAVQPAQF
jgi:hypothetical protein